MLFLPVKTKKDFVNRFYTNEFGNRGPVWQTLQDFRNASPTGLLHLRNRIAGGATYYDLEPATADSLWSTRKDPNNWYLAEMAPTTKTLIQGEVMLTERGISLYYSKIPLPMRNALATKATTSKGIIVVTLLRYYLCPNSYEWLGTLLERYPGHVIEFSTYSVNWGIFPHFNTVFWEVRKY